MTHTLLRMKAAVMADQIEDQGCVYVEDRRKNGTTVSCPIFDSSLTETATVVENKLMNFAISVPIIFGNDMEGVARQSSLYQFENTAPYEREYCTLPYLV